MSDASTKYYKTVTLAKAVQQQQVFLQLIMICAVVYSEVGVAQNSSQVAQVAQMRNLRCALCLFFQHLRNLRCALCLFFSACAICVCESVNLIFVAL